MKLFFKFLDSVGGKLKISGGCGRYLIFYDSLLGKNRKVLVKGFGLFLKFFREGKYKRVVKIRKMEVGFKVRG